MMSNSEYRIGRPIEVHYWNPAVEANNRPHNPHETGVRRDEGGRVPLKADERRDRLRADRRTFRIGELRRGHVERIRPVRGRIRLHNRSRVNLTNNKALLVVDERYA